MNVAEVAHALLTMTIMSSAGEMSSMADDKLKGLMDVARHRWDTPEETDTIQLAADICSRYKTAEIVDLVKALRISEHASTMAVTIHLVAAADEHSIPPSVVIEYIKDHHHIVSAVTTAVRSRMIQMWMGMPLDVLMDTIRERIEAGESGDASVTTAVTLDPHMPPGTTIQ